MDMGWQQGVLGGMKSEMMAHVYDVGREVGGNAPGEFYGILYGLVRGMRFMAQTVYYQYFYSFQQLTAP